MGSKKTQYTQEFRSEAMKWVTEQGYSQAEAARRLGLNTRNLNRWVKEAKWGCKLPRGGVSLNEEQAELQLLRKEIKRLKQEREILKKPP